jgi:hypothetical protein
MKKGILLAFLWSFYFLNAQYGLLGEYYNGTNFEKKSDDPH